MSWRNIKLGLIMLRNIFWKVGVFGDYKRVFWKFALRRLARGEIEYLISSVMVAHHLIMFSRDGVGRQNQRFLLFAEIAGSRRSRRIGDGREPRYDETAAVSAVSPAQLDLISA